MGWDIDTDSPLLELDDGRPRGRFALDLPAAPPLPHVDGLLAGAAEVDITPPPGMPKAGYSSNACNGRGFRTRLRARILHLRAGTSSLALVQCDLLGGSAVVQRLVARALADTTDVPLAGLFVGATHTHAGPGQFLGTDFYNRFASNHAGFDPAWTQFLVGRIAGGVARAVAERRPARLATGSIDVWGLTRNRSLAPHVLNPAVTDKRTEPQRKFLAVNPLLHLLRVDARAEGSTGYEPLAAAVVFSVHGTGIPNTAEEYNADLWAYLVGELADRIEQDSGIRPVVGAMEGTHADVAPALRPGQAGPLEARRIGRGVGARAAELHRTLEARLTDAVDLGAGLRELDLTRDRSAGGVTLPNRPAVGAALVAGAHENLTPVLGQLPPFRAGTPRSHRPGDPQGAKWVLGSRWLQPVILPLRSFPRVLPVQILRIGGTALVGLPFEITVESGRRIAAEVTGALAGTGVEEVVVSSVANEYSGYVTTAEEYGLQHYEGGHTIYGPNTQRFLAAEAGRLAADLAGLGAVDDTLDHRPFDLRLHRYLPGRSPDTVPRSILGPATFTDPTAAEDAFWETTWRDGPPGNLDWHDPLVRVEAADRDGDWTPARREGRPVDDGGWDLSVIHLGPDPTRGHRYRVRWFDPELRGGRRHRFVILGNAGRPEIVSDPFD